MVRGRRWAYLAERFAHTSGESRSDLEGTLIEGPHVREEVYNVKLAELLADRGAVNCTAEQIHSEGIPDVLGTWYGVRFVLEAKYDQSGAGEAVLTQVTKRLKAGFGVLGIAVLYPEELGRSTQAAERALSRAYLQVRFVRPGGRPGVSHQVLGVDGLVGLLSQARDLLVGDDRLKESVDGRLHTLRLWWQHLGHVLACGLISRKHRALPAW